jgi:hypothetical protein
MATVDYKVSRRGEQWAVARQGEVNMTYVTQEAAFEAATLQAGGDLRSGHDIVIQVGAATDPRGAVDLGGSPMKGDGFHN